MQQPFRLLAAALFPFLLTWLASCSEQPCAPECYKSLQLTRKSLEHFTAHLANGPADQLVVELQKWLSADGFYQKLCLKYLIGSVAVLGKADRRALDAISELCSGRRSASLRGLLFKLRTKNDIDTLVQHAAENLLDLEADSFVGEVLGELTEKNWDVMRQLSMKTLGILKSTNRNAEYCVLLRHLPVELQYKMIRTREVPLNLIGRIYHGREADPLLREIFFMARCSRSPDPEIRECIAKLSPFFEQSLADGSIGSNTKIPCPDNVPTLREDVLHHMSRFMDIETLVFVVPLVCKAWRDPHWRILMHDARIHGLYLLDLDFTRLKAVHRITPWRSYLRNRTDVLKYFGQCIEGGALDGIRPFSWLMWSAKEYLREVVEGRILLPRFADCTTQYEAFVRLFEMIYECCWLNRPELDKPRFLTDEEYERAVHYFVYEKGWALKLSESLAAVNMPRLFSIIEEDEVLMKKLVRPNFCSFETASLALIVSGQTRKIPCKLARLLFSQTDLFRALVAPKVVPCNEYYSFVAEHDILPKVIRSYRDPIVITFPRFVTCLILSFKDKPDTIDRIEASIASEFMRPGNPKLQEIKQCFGRIPFGSLMAAEGHSTDDFEFFKGVMVRCGLL